MAKSATARARVEPEVKREAEKILSECGLSPSQAISLFYRQVILERGIPFQIKSFNEATRRNATAEVPDQSKGTSACQCASRPGDS